MQNAQQPTNQHLIFIRGTQWNHGMSPGQLQQVMTDFYAWVDGLKTSGVLVGAQPLMEEGKLVSGSKGAFVTDGVFAESKEAIAGYFLLAVPTMDEALNFARACPILDHGANIEVRPIADVCQPMAVLKAQQ